MQSSQLFSDKFESYKKMITKWVDQLTVDQRVQLSSDSLPNLPPDDLGKTFNPYRELIRMLKQAQEDTVKNDNSIIKIIKNALSQKIKEPKKITFNFINSFPALQTSFLFQLPADVINLLFFQFLNGVNGFNLIRAIPRFYLFKNSISCHQDHPLRRLLGHGALGELESAQRIWMQDKLILSFYGTIYHPNRDYTVNPPLIIPFSKSFGRYKYVNVTYWQILLMNHEWEEAIMVSKHMSPEEMAKQFFEIFPDGKIVKYDWSLEKAKELLATLFTAVINDVKINANDVSRMSKRTQKAWNEFFDYNKPNPNGYGQGLVCNPEIVLEAMELCENRFGEFKNDERRLFWSIQVEERLKSLLGTGFLRSCSQADNLFGESTNRTGCIFPDGTSYFSFRRSSNSLPGFHFAVSTYGKQIRSYPGIRAGSYWFKQLLSNNNKAKDILNKSILANKCFISSNSL